MGTGARGTRTLALGVAVGLIGLVGPSSAGGATTVGQTFVPDGGFGPDFTTLQTTFPGSQYTVPSAGVVTSWSFHAAATQVPVGMRLKVGRPVGGNVFTIVGQSGPQSPVANALNTYTDVAIPVQAGDVIGFYNGTASALAAAANPGCAATCLEHELEGDVQTGITTLFDGPYDNSRLDISVSVEPDCDGDGLGDETQDSSLTGANCPFVTPQARTLTLDASKSKAKKGKEVTFSGQLTASQGECQAGQTVELMRSKPGKDQFVLIEQIATFATGGFEVDAKVKKTAEYRAEVGATGACAAVASDTEKVKVKRKK